jgi:outer membrane receptor protein involved in Fe transport
VTISGSLVLTSSRYRDEIKLPALEGHQVPQIPFYQAALGVTYSASRIGTLAAQVRAAGRQFEDDLNTLVLAPFKVVDVSASRPVTRGLQAFVAVENLFNTEIQTGRTPVTKIGWPRMVRAGLRVVLP